MGVLKSIAESIPLSCEADGYEGPWVLTISDQGRAGYGVNNWPTKTALYFESYEALCNYWDSVKHLPRGIKFQVDSFPLRRATPQVTKEPPQ